MENSEHITNWLTGLKSGDEAAAQAVWERYYAKLLKLACRNMVALRKREVDEEDVALSAMNTFLRGAANGRFPRLNDRHDLWKILLTCTLRKVSKQRKRQTAEKRNEERLRGDSMFSANDESRMPGGLAEAAISPRTVAGTSGGA